MATHKPIAVLLVHPSDVEASPQRPSPEFYRDLYINDPQSLDAFWRQVSDGAIDLEGTQVFGWRSHGLTRMGFQALSRGDKIKRAVDVFANAVDPKDRVDLTSFDSVSVFGDPSDELGSVGIASYDLQGTIHALGSSIFDIGTDHRTVAHELGHGFGFDHSFNSSPTPLDPANDSRPGAYGDTWDIMSANRVTSFTTRFGQTGPGLNTVMRDIAGWLQPSRVLEGHALNLGKAVIYDVNEPAASRPHVMRLDEYYFELTMNNGWYAGFPGPSVQVRQRDFNAAEHSRLLLRDQVFGSPRYSMQAGDSFTVGSKAQVFKRYLKVTVSEIDAPSRSATLSVEYQPPVRVPQAGAGAIFGGVTVDGGGFIIINGRIHRVPPRGPLAQLLETLSVITVIDQIRDRKMRSRMAKSTLRQLREDLAELAGQIDADLERRE